MANRNSSESRQGDTRANRAAPPEKGSGEQTGDERGQKIDKAERESYRSSQQKRQKGNHGDNR